MTQYGKYLDTVNNKEIELTEFFEFFYVVLTDLGKDKVQEILMHSQNQTNNLNSEGKL